MSTPVRRCTKCGIEKPLDRAHFYVSRTSREGLSTICKTCHIAVTTQYNKEHAEKHRTFARESWRRKHSKAASS